MKKTRVRVGYIFKDEATNTIYEIWVMTGITIIIKEVAEVKPRSRSYPRGVFISLLENGVFTPIEAPKAKDRCDCGSAHDSMGLHSWWCITKGDRA